MPKATTSATLVERMCRPQQIGVFGHRGVGKTTFLTMLYREAVGGRLPDLRLGAADATTANYLHDRILQLEQGEPLPATLAETDLRFHLYHEGARQELLVRDYQGEHVGIGKEEPIRDYLQDCDAIWICLDPAVLASRGDNLRGQQEVEQLVEDYLKLKPEPGLHRPMALVVTKADLLHQSEVQDAQAMLSRLVEENLGMTAHALREHAPGYEFFGVSSLGRSLASNDTGTTLEPVNLDLPLRWLATSLQAQDEARMERLFADSSVKLAALEKCVKVFAERYPASDLTVKYQKRLKLAKSRQRRRRGLIATAVMLLLGLSTWLYDRTGFSEVKRMASEESNPAVALSKLKNYQKLHPTRHLLSVNSPKEEQKLEQELRTKLAKEARASIVKKLEQMQNSPQGADPSEVASLFADYRNTLAAPPLSTELLAFEKDNQERAAQRDLDALFQAERKLPVSIARSDFDEMDPWRKAAQALVVRAQAMIAKHEKTSTVVYLRDKCESYARRIEEHDFEIAENYSRRNPKSFQTRLERYQGYLDRHPQGLFVNKAKEAITEVRLAWDKQDFRVVRDHFQEKPAQLEELVKLCGMYEARHPNGKYIAKAKELLRWAARVKGDREYQVTLLRGDFDQSSTSRWYTKGPDFAVTVEVNGVRYGPSTIIQNSYTPEWNYVFPRPIRWKIGDKVRLIVMDYDYWNVTAMDHSSEDSDQMSLRLLSGKTHANGHSLYFSSDFWMPEMPVLD